MQSAIGQHKSVLVFLIYHFEFLLSVLTDISKQKSWLTRFSSNKNPINSEFGPHLWIIGDGFVSFETGKCGIRDFPKLVLAIINNISQRILSMSSVRQVVDIQNKQGTLGAFPSSTAAASKLQVTCTVTSITYVPVTYKLLG